MRVSEREFMERPGLGPFWRSALAGGGNHFMPGTSGTKIQLSRVSRCPKKFAEIPRVKEGNDMNTTRIAARFLLLTMGVISAIAISGMQIRVLANLRPSPNTTAQSK